ncbi:unnamed protein product [Trichobilharzia szidati]|nr:unnamed protein product [Trichobilharzia szidati]
MLYIGKQLISWLSQTNTPNSFTVKNSNNYMNTNPSNYNYNFNNAIYEDPITMSISEKDKIGNNNINNNNHSNGSPWTLNSMNVQISTIEQETWNNLERNSWLPYLDTVDDYLRKTRDDLDTKVIDYWAPYDQLLANLLINPWIAPARRALNTSWLQEKRISFMDRTYFGLLSNDIDSEDENQQSNDVSMLNGARETQSLMLSNFIGVPQPAHARLAGTRIWNSFRNLVPGLPSKFYYKLEPSSTSTSSSSSPSSSLSLSSTMKASAVNKDNDFQKKPKLYHDYRQMLSNEDWYHIPSGQLSLNDKQSIVDFTDFSTHFSVFATAVTKKSGSLMSSDTNAYFLTLTQVRLLLLLLDAIIILARCFQTFNFMHNIWFGDTRLVSGNHSLHENSQVMIESFDSPTIQQQQQQHRQSQSLSLTQSQLQQQQQQQQQHSTSPSHPSNYHYQLQQNIRSPKRIPLPVGSTPFLHPTSCSSSIRESNHHSVSNEFPTSPTRNYNETMVVNQSIRMNDCERKSSTGTGMNISQSSNPPTSLHFDNGTGRFTACYCCLDTHYLLVITGIGLLFIGLVLLWATDRHVRPGWLLAKTGVFARSRALEDCRQRTNAILKTIQPNHINMDLIRSARINAAREAHWMNQLTNRLTHVQTHIQLQFITELCLLQKGLANHYYVLNQHQPHQQQHQQAGQIHLPETGDTKSSFSACELIGPNSQFTEQALSILSTWRLDPMTNKQIKHTLKTPTCHFSPIVPATYAESHLSRLLRMTSLNDQDYHHPKKNLKKQKSKMSVFSANNQTDEFTQTDGNQLDFDYEQITTSIGSLSTLINAVYRLMLTSLTVMIAMGGLLVCLHMISILARMIIRIPVRKIYYASSYPPYTSSVNNQSYSPTPFRRRNSLSR